MHKCFSHSNKINQEVYQFFDIFEDFFGLTPRKLARTQNTITIDCEVATNTKYCGKFLINDLTDRPSIVGRPIADKMKYMLNQYQLNTSPISGMASFLQTVFNEIHTKYFKITLKYNKGVLESADATFHTRTQEGDDQPIEYYIALYRSGFVKAYSNADSNLLSDLNMATDRCLLEKFTDFDSIIFDNRIPFESLIYHNISLRKEWPSFTVGDFRQFLPNINSISAANVIPSFLSVIQIINNDTQLNLLWDESMRADLYNSSNQLYIYSEEDKKVSCLVLENVELRKRYIIWYEALPCILSL